MTSLMTPRNNTPHAKDAVRILNEAWSYYTPVPCLVTDANSQPSPVIDEYYAA
jgi:hypothetical protein